VGRKSAEKERKGRDNKSVAEAVEAATATPISP
jgi:hypothetical protein